MAEPLTRKQLYELVWQKPISQIAKEYGLSDRGLGKLCERNNIPVPSRGYWARVKAGQKIGVIGQYSNTDIAVQVGGFNGQFISYFDVIPDSIFAKYTSRGIKTRDDIIISKAERDVNPLQCNGEQFAKNYDSDPTLANFVYLSER